MDDVLDGDACGNRQCQCPAIETEVGMRHDETIEWADVVADNPPEQQRKEHDGGEFLHNGEGGLHEGEVGTLFKKRKDGGNGEGAEQTGEERVGGHRVDVASDFPNDDGGCRGTGADDAGECGFGEQFVRSIALQQHDGAGTQGDEEQLGECQCQVPAAWLHLVEIDFGEGDKEGEKNAERKEGVEECAEPCAGIVERRDKVERQVTYCTDDDGNGQRPFFQEVE